MKPTLGRIVLYTLSASEDAINDSREFAAIVTTTHGDGYCCNLRVFVDGDQEADLWRTSVLDSRSGDSEPGTWRWPPRD